MAKGIPANQADHLADLDKHGYVYVRTPLAHHTWATEMAQNPHLTMAEIRKTNKDLSYVLRDKGIAQGDLDSCMRYIIFKDITLVTLLNDPQREKIYIRGSAGILHEVIDICYADDLTTFSVTVAGQQRKADIIGNFAQIFNLKINIVKLRAAGCNFGMEDMIQKNATI